MAILQAILQCAADNALATWLDAPDRTTLMLNCDGFFVATGRYFKQTFNLPSQLDFITEPILAVFIGVILVGLALLQNVSIIVKCSYRFRTADWISD